jgi:hypothetical protein
MITITNTIAIAIAIPIPIPIPIAIPIPITIISIGPQPNVHRYTHNQWKAGTRFRWKIRIGDLLSPSSNCLPFLWNLSFQL